MNQHDLAQSVRNAVQGISITRSTAIVEAIFDGIFNALARGEEVRISGFGAFEVTTRQAGKGRNPKTGEAIDIPAKRVAKFRPFNAMKDALNPVPRVGGRRVAPASGERRRARA